MKRLGKNLGWLRRADGGLMAVRQASGWARVELS